MTIKELEAIAEETRALIIETCAKNGGHLAPSLGTVELTIALLKVLNVPDDKIIWDVGHQAYSYKILTDRREKFHTLRTMGGISGFPKRAESPYDFFGTGHGGTSISAALGIKEALRIAGNDSKVVAVIGDGAMTSGLALEAMNHAGSLGKNLVTVLNDNDMFISSGVGALSSWFSRKLSGQTYSAMRSEIKARLSHLPPFFHGEKIIDGIRKLIDSSKSLITPGILFEGLGYQYVGPIDGHDLDLLIKTLEDIKHNPEPILLHVHTIKGKGYQPAEKNPRSFHGVGPFDNKTGIASKMSGESFTGVLESFLPRLFKKNPKLVAITAAMPDGTGLAKLQKEMPERVYDVGMAEAHAVTFAAGLAAGGMIPLVALYSSFSQRAFDSIVHDVALQNLPVILMIDRAGIVGEDGATHHGIFDIAFMRMIPGMVIMAPRNEREMVKMVELAITLNRPVAIRYPRGTVLIEKASKSVESGKGEVLREGSGTLIISVGIMAQMAMQAAEKAEKAGIDCMVYDLKFIKPLPEELFEYIESRDIHTVIVAEEGVVAGGAGSSILEEMSRRGINKKSRLIGIGDEFPLHGRQNEIREQYGISAKEIYKAICKINPSVKLEANHRAISSDSIM